MTNVFDTFRVAEADGKTPGIKTHIAIGCNGKHHAIDVCEMELDDAGEVVFSIPLHNSVVGLCDSTCANNRKRLGGFMCDEVPAAG